MSPTGDLLVTQFFLGKCPLELAQGPSCVALAWHKARGSTPFGVTKISLLLLLPCFFPCLLALLLLCCCLAAALLLPCCLAASKISVLKALPRKLPQYTNQFGILPRRPLREIFPKLEAFCWREAPNPQQREAQVIQNTEVDEIFFFFPEFWAPQFHLE